MTEHRQKMPLGELLIRQRLITPDQLDIALAEQRQRHAPLGRILVRLGFLNDNVLRDALAGAVGQAAIDLSHAVADPEALRLVPQEFARRFRLLPIAFDAERKLFTVAVTEIFNIVALDQLRTTVGSDIEIRTLIAGEAQLEDYTDQFYGYELSVDGILQEIQTGEIDHASMAVGGDEYTQPITRLVNALLVDAVKRGASDIHFEPEHAFLRIRYRIDGALETVRSLHKTYLPAMTVRIKVMSALNIAETRAPQDGRLALTLNGRLVDFRVSTHPTIHGENLVLRILDRERSIIPLDKMQLPRATRAQLDRVLARPEGILIVTGPTGSGKTTMLYSLLAQVNSEEVNIMTLEDPVEYPVMLMRQTSVNESARMDFANGIRSMMRQDPDIILVGEIRDKDTAEMAFRAAMTGHQVFSTLHTNSALGAFPRLLDIGIPPDILAGNIIGVTAQRLVRKLCPHCRAPYAPSAAERAALGAGGVDAAQIYRAVGCAQCRHTGYRGRHAIMELLTMDGDLDELVARRATAREIRTLALGKGFRPIAEDAIACVLDGTTSLAEAARAVDLSGRIF